MSCSILYNKSKMSVKLYQRKTKYSFKLKARTKASNTNSNVFVISRMQGCQHLRELKQIPACRI